MAAIAGFVGWSTERIDNSWALLFVAMCLVGMAAFGAYLAHVRVYEDASDASRAPGSFTPLVDTLTYKRRVAEVMLDFCLITIAYYAAYRLRFEGAEFGANFSYFLKSLPIFVASELTALFIVGAYRGMWRYFSLMDGVVFAKATLLGTVTSQLILLYLYRFENYSRTVFVIAVLLLFVALVVSRASFRLIGEFIAQLQHSDNRVVIYGAGDGGSIVLREVLKMSRPSHVLGFVDDDARKERVRVQGYAVLGNRTYLRDLISHRGVEEVVISSKHIPDAIVEDLLGLCSTQGVTLSRFQLQLETLRSSTSPTVSDNIRPFRDAHESRRRQSSGEPR
jgi:UDP-GlcNAc:undecaprenyl-phosphate GlcNAc-1-phosphate transferase